VPEVPPPAKVPSDPITALRGGHDSQGLHVNARMWAGRSTSCTRSPRARDLVRLKGDRRRPTLRQLPWQLLHLRCPSRCQPLPAQHRSSCHSIT
jgi:hypothetical protein